MGQAKRRKQLLGSAYGRPYAEIAADHIRPVAIQSECNIRITTAISNGDCVPQVALTHQYMDNPSDWVAQAGVLVAYDNTYKEWDCFWQMGHVWLFNPSTNTILDPTIPNWAANLKQLRFELNAGALDAPQQAVGTADLLPLFDKLKGTASVGSADFVYIPGVTALDYVNARKPSGAMHEQAKQNVKMLWASKPHDWQQFVDETVSNGNCIESLKATFDVTAAA